jgi:hypothetical protein
VTEEIHITRRALREPPLGFSRRTRRVLLGLTVGTLVLGTALVVGTVTAQGLRAEGRDDAAALTAALEAAQADAATLTTALEDTSAFAADARALADILAPRREDVSAEAVDGVARAVDAFGAAVGAPTPEPSLPDAVGTPSALPGRYVAADRAELDELRTRVAAEIDRLDAVGRRSVERVAELAELATAVSNAAGAAAQAAVATAPTTLTASPEAPADTRTRFEEAVAALTALGDAPDPGAGTRQAFTTFFTAADTLRRAHDEAVLAREAAELEAAEREAAEREAAEREAAEREAERPWWWWGDDDDWPPRRG